MSKRDRERRGDLMDTDTWLGGQTSSGGMLCFKPPSKASLFQPDKAGTYLLDIYPYRADGKVNPRGEEVNGKRLPDCMFFMHRNVGPNRDKILCPGQTYRRKCFVCDYRAKLGSSPDRDKDTEEQLKQLLAKQRQLWNVFNHDEPKKGWQIFEYSFHLFGKNIAERIANSREKDRQRFSKFWHPGEAGLTIEALASEEKSAFGNFINFGQISFKDRSSKLVARLDELGEPWSLDKCLRETPYGEVKKIFLAVGGGDDEDEDEDTEEEEDDDLDDDTGDDDEDDTDDDEDGDEGDDEEGDDDDADDDEEDEEEDEDEEAVAPCEKGDGVLVKTAAGKKKGKVLKVIESSEKVKVKLKTGVQVLPWSKVLKVIDEDVPF